MEEIKKTRKNNLIHLIDKYGGQSPLARSSGTSQSYINHIIGNRRNLGEKLCRKIEENLKLESGWMDSNHK